MELRVVHEVGVHAQGEGRALQPRDRLVAFLTEGPSLLDLI